MDAIVPMEIVADIRVCTISSNKAGLASAAVTAHCMPCLCNWIPCCRWCVVDRSLQLQQHPAWWRKLGLNRPIRSLALAAEGTYRRRFFFPELQMAFSKMLENIYCKCVRLW